MNILQNTLDQAAEDFFAVHRELDRMRQAANRAGVGRIGEQLEAIRERAVLGLNRLVEAGAAHPQQHLRRERGDPTAVPLHLLDTPANRELLRCLLLTREAAQAVDKERGHDGDGFAEVIEHFAAQVQTEIHGPVDVRQGH